MNIRNDSGRRVTMLVSTTVATIVLAACAAAPVKPDGAAEARSKLTLLQSDPNLATRAPQALAAADAAVRVAELPGMDQELGAYRVYMADRKVEIARAEAQTRFAEDQRVLIGARRERARLEARTQEANVAEGQVALARGERDLAKGAAAGSAQQAAELQQQIQALQAKQTDRGLVLTLGDVLFASGSSKLNPDTAGNLGRLVDFLNKYPDRTAVIQGYTDSIGGSGYNDRLSEGRAEAVRAYLSEHGISPVRLSSSGKGSSDPIAGNDSAIGRQRNRRVEVIISNPVAASL